jgi:putative membrane protein
MRKGVAYRWFLLSVFVVVWIWAAINPVYPHDWLLENYLVFIFVPLILISAWYFRLSNVSYTLLTLFMCLHVMGSHYTYAEVPFGYVLQDWFNADRNMYDRIVHFSFGFLLAYPVREVFMRLSRAKGFWGFWFPIELTFAFSAIYEVIEWLTALNVDPSAGLAFLGAQGDVWDAQKDMLLAGIGSVIAMIVTGFIRVRYDKNFWMEFVESFKISKNDSPLGEEAIERLKRKR